MSRPRSATNRLEQARADHASANAKLNELETARAAALLADEDGKAVALDAEIEQQQRLVRGFHDKIGLLEGEAAKEANERRVREHAALIGRIEKKLAERDAAGAELADAIKKADQAFRRMIDAGQAAIAAWPWASHDVHPCMLSPGSITTAIQHELYRVGGRPQLLGGQIEKPGAGVHFPGGRSPSIQLAGLPERIKPLRDVLHESSALASRIMRTGKSTSHIEVVAAPASVPVSTNGGAPAPRPDAELRLGQLLKEQARLSEDVSPQGEAEYHRVVSEIAKVQSELAAAKQMEAHRGS
jgi:hypothetical protein